MQVLLESINPTTRTVATASILYSKVIVSYFVLSFAHHTMVRESVEVIHESLWYSSLGKGDYIMIPHISPSVCFTQ